jgi:hypothetical protein
VELDLTGLAWDARCLCALCPAGVRGADGGGLRNAHGHVTLAIAPGAATVDANSMLQRLADGGGGGGGGDITVDLFDTPLRLRGHLRRFAPLPSAAAGAGAAAAGSGGV